MKTTNYSALCALTLALMAPNTMALAQEAVPPDATEPVMEMAPDATEPVTEVAPDATAPLTEVTQLEPDPGTAAPRLIVPEQTEALRDALKQGDWEAATVAIQGGADVNLVDKNGTTVLMMAAQANKPDVVQLLLDSGAQADAVDKKGRNALHYAIPPDPKPKKKKFGLGNVMGAINAVGGVGNLAGGLGKLGKIPGLNSLLGQDGLNRLLGNNLTQLLGGGEFDLQGKSGWMAIAGAALQGDATGDLGIASLLTGNGDLKLKTGDWVNLLSSVKGKNAQILGAMANLGAGDSAKSELWSQFLTQAAAGNQTSVALLMNDPKLSSLLSEATQGLLLARGEIPGNASRSIIGALIERGLDTSSPDKSGKTALQLATERGLGELFGG